MLMRYVLTAAWAFPVFLAFALPSSRGGVLASALGAAIIALLTGVVAMMIPVRRKWLFVVPSILSSLVFIYVLGTLT